jgi:hypothetical protein
VAGAVIALLWRRGVEYSRARTFTVFALCAFVFLAAEVRVVIASQMPSTTRSFHERLTFASDAIARGDCVEGREAFESARRLIPDSPEVASTKVMLTAVCR